MTDREISLLWLYTAEVWPAFKIPADADLRALKQQAWADQLGDLDAKLVRAALVHLGAAEFAPPLGKIRVTTLDLARRQRGEPAAPDLDQAWAEITAAFHRVGSYSTPEWSHPAVTATVAALDWKEMCKTTELGVLRGQFARLYDAAKTRTERARDPLPPAIAELLGSAAIGHPGALELEAKT